MKSSALILNIFVSLLSFYQFYKGGYFRWKLFYPFIITSIPFSFIGAYLTIDAALYKKILGVLLIFSIMRLMGIVGKETVENKKLSLPWALFIGAGIGLFSGMIGIGGGIILSPIILLLHWANMKETAAVSALFIFINSTAGLLGASIRGIQINPQVYIWLLLAVAGGILGSFVARKQFSNKIITYFLAFVLAIASAKLIMI